MIDLDPIKKRLEAAKSGDLLQVLKNAEHDLQALVSEVERLRSRLYEWGDKLELTGGELLRESQGRRG